MQVLLAGYNLDVETLEDLKRFIEQLTRELQPETFPGMDSVSKANIIKQLYTEARVLLDRDNLTPETLSAAYARISRNPKPVNDLRKIARQEVERARKSNRNIIFGLGHSSVAEHAVFNFDIIGVSRLAVEEIEHFRLASYTEKSQRYILFEDDFVVPEEIKNSSWEKKYVALIKEQYSVYHELYKKLRPFFFEKYSDLAENPKNNRLLEGLAKEDARYVISLATQTQLGMTANARSVENIISKCFAHPLAEVRKFAELIHKAVDGYAPSLIKYVEPTRYLLDKRRQIYNFLNSKNSYLEMNNSPTDINVRLLEYPKDADDQILSAVLFRHTQADYNQAKAKITNMSLPDKMKFFQVIFKNMNSWDNVLREFEFVYFTFQLIASAGNFGQLKRHRMANIISQPYDIELGFTVPASISQTGQEKVFCQIMQKTNNFYKMFSESYLHNAEYILTNAHRRRILFKINLRELYHFARLREDEHAQWDIRQIAIQMRKLIEGKLPLAGGLLCGKDQFEKTYQKFIE